MAEMADKSVCTDEGTSTSSKDGAARLEAVFIALVESKSRELHAKYHRHPHPLLLLLKHSKHKKKRHHRGLRTSPDSPPLASHATRHWMEKEGRPKSKRKCLKLRGPVPTSDNLELVQRGSEVRAVGQGGSRRSRSTGRGKHRTLVVSAIDEQMKVIHVLDPDELPRRARYTIMVTACLLLFLCLLLVGVTLRMAPLIDDIVRQENERLMLDAMSSSAAVNRTQYWRGAAAVLPDH